MTQMTHYLAFSLTRAIYGYLQFLKCFVLCKRTQSTNKRILPSLLVSCILSIPGRAEATRRNSWETDRGEKEKQTHTMTLLLKAYILRLWSVGLQSSPVTRTQHRDIEFKGFTVSIICSLCVRNMPHTLLTQSDYSYTDHVVFLLPFFFLFNVFLMLPDYLAHCFCGN